MSHSGLDTRSGIKSAHEKISKKRLISEARLVPLNLRAGHASPSKSSKKSPDDDDVRFAGKPFPAEEARERWPERYQSKKRKVKLGASSSESNDVESNEKEVMQARCHYTRAVVDGCVFNLYDDAFIKAEEGKPNFIAKIVELSETVDRELYFTAQWFFRAEDTIIKHKSDLIDKKRVFYSDIKDDNPLTSIVSKVKIVRLAAKVGLAEKEKILSSSDLYCDMAYSLPHFSFTTLETATENLKTESDASAISDVSSNSALGNLKAAKSSQVSNFEDSTMTLLDLYSGCGAMSTGLCLGASISGLKLVTRWAVDINSNACKSLKLNHPEAEVRNEAAEDFLSLLKEWEKLCKKFHLFGSHLSEDSNSEHNSLDSDEDDDNAHGSTVSPGEFEVGKLLAVCYGDPNKVNRRGLYFKVRWRGYGPSEDTWEPFDGLSKCTDSLKDFVTRGFISKILPLPGDVDFICGGPPCQGMSGFNRYRNLVDPLKDPKNHQLVVFMDIFEFLKPKYVLMENVVDILKLGGGVLGCYAIGSFGVPQCRMRVFLWGAHPMVAKATSISFTYTSLSAKWLFQLNSRVTNYESRDEMLYSQAPCTNFQKYIRLKRPDMFQSIVVSKNASGKTMLYDHIPLQLNDDDYERVCLIPKKKGANFRDLPGVLVGPNSKVQWDPSLERVKVSSGKPLVPNYAIKFVRGISTKPFARLWWDEFVSTVGTRAEPHKRAMLHPEQGQVLTVRENARLQGFPDWYKFWGPVKERYIQVGNAVAFPVSMALGSMLAKGGQGVSNNEPLTTTDLKFHMSLPQLFA
ncbi:unnamed protein product [Camellia sinensis]